MNENHGELKVFAGRNQIDFTRGVCEHLRLPIGVARTEVFPDGELISHIEEDVRGRDCFVVLSTCEPVNDNLMELLIFADSLRRSSAKRLTAVIPYFGYGRQDRKERGRTPITAKLVANLIAGAGFDRVVAIDLHAAQIQGFFDIPVDHLSAAPVFADYLLGIREELGDVVVVSPDVGNVKVATGYADFLGGDLAITFKKRISGSEVQASQIVGNVKNRTVLMVDDMISTGGTICEAARVLRDAGANRIIVAATHGVFCGPAVERISKSHIDRLIVTNTIPHERRTAPIKGRVVTLCVSKLFADAIRHIHENKSISALFKQFAESKR